MSSGQNEIMSPSCATLRATYLRGQSTCEILALLRGLVFSVNAVIANVGGGGRFAKAKFCF